MCFKCYFQPLTCQNEFDTVFEKVTFSFTFFCTVSSFKCGFGGFLCWFRYFLLLCCSRKQMSKWNLKEKRGWTQSVQLKQAVSFAFLACHKRWLCEGRFKTPRMSMWLKTHPANNYQRFHWWAGFRFVISDKSEYESSSFAQCYSVFLCQFRKDAKCCLSHAPSAGLRFSDQLTFAFVFQFKRHTADFKTPTADLSSRRRRGEAAGILLTLKAFSHVWHTLKEVSVWSYWI